jgi:hypothetical protein
MNIVVSQDEKFFVSEYTSGRGENNDDELVIEGENDDNDIYDDDDDLVDDESDDIDYDEDTTEVLEAAVVAALAERGKVKARVHVLESTLAEAKSKLILCTGNEFRDRTPIYTSSIQPISHPRLEATYVVIQKNKRLIALPDEFWEKRVFPNWQNDFFVGSDSDVEYWVRVLIVKQLLLR